jgi:hypothetical protein
MKNKNIKASPSIQANVPAPIAITPLAYWTALGRSEHVAQFYEDDAALMDSVAGFIGAGFSDEESVIVIATKAHREGVHERLRDLGHDPIRAQMLGHFFPLDAAETLIRISRDGQPCGRLFSHVVGRLVARASHCGRPLRAFGEMVALLWQAGNPKGVLHLEELWNDLGRMHSFKLFCGYPASGFSGEADAKPLRHICKAHTRIIPSQMRQWD